MTGRRDQERAMAERTSQWGTFASGWRQPAPARTAGLGTSPTAGTGGSIIRTVRVLPL